MTPKEKAEELVEKFREHSKYWDCYNDVPEDEDHAKLSAIIAVDEIIAAVKRDSDFTITYEKAQQYWQEVKEEINKL